MNLTIVRRLFPISCAALMMISACGVQLESPPETDAELYCRQAGFQLESAGYEDCVEAPSELALSPAGERQSDTADRDDERAEPSMAETKTVTIAHSEDSGSLESSKRATAIGLARSDQPSFVAHLSSVRTRAETEAEWKRLRERFPDLLGDREMIVRSVELEDKGTYFRVLTGPFADDVKAEGFCATFKSRQQYCLAMRL